MKERIFIQRAKEHSNLEEFVRKQFSQAKCGSIEVQHTPIMTRIIIHTITPGLVIGSGGERIKETLEELKKKFKLENPQIDVQRIENPDMDPYIIAQSIASSIEKGINFKRLGNYYTSRIMKAGAVGCELVFSGKFTGQRGRKERFSAGYLKKCGEPADRDVIKGFAVASPKLGNTGVTVKIMVSKPSVILKEEPVEEMKPEEKLEPEIRKVKEEETSKEKETKKEDITKEKKKTKKTHKGKEKSRDIKKEKKTKRKRKEKTKKPDKEKNNTQ